MEEVLTLREQAEKLGVVFGEEHADIPLSRELDISGAKVKSLRMREPTVRDQRAVQKISDQADLEMTLLANLCQVAPSDLDSLKLRDYKRVQAAYLAFTE